MAAGRGERLRPLTDQTPKPLISVRGKPILAHLLDQISAQLSVKRVVLNAWHLKEQIEAFAKSAKYPFSIFVSSEEELLGTGGGLKRALPLIGDAPFLMMNGDCLWEGDLKNFSAAPNGDPKLLSKWWLAPVSAEQTLIEMDASGTVCTIGNLHSSPASGATVKGCFSGIQRVERVFPERLPEKGCILRNYMIPLLKEGYRLKAEAGGLQNWSDLGTPERLKAADRLGSVNE